METKIFYRCEENDKLIQYSFIKLEKTGEQRGMNIYRETKIVVWFVKPKEIYSFPKNTNLSDHQLKEYSPLNIMKHEGEIREDGHVYKYYVDNYQIVDIHFATIEYLYDNFISLKRMLNDCIDYVQK